MNKEKKTQYIIYVVLGVAVLGSLLFVLRPAKGGVTAKIQVGDTIVRELSLDTAKDGEFSIEDETGLPITFEVRDHAIRFKSSDCPDKVCIKSGFMRRDMDIASCLPNRTILTVEE